MARTPTHTASLDPWTTLTALREKDGHTKTSLARTAGISLGYVNDLETGRREPNPAVTKKLADALNVPISALEKYRRGPRHAPVARKVPA